ncbi:MAG: TolC family protein [Myxococcales bacterium]|nr:TolC family protein [Myxococcales bacterium]
MLAALDAEGRAEAELSHAESADGRDAMRMLFLEAGRGCVDWIVSSAIAGRSRDYANHLAEVRDAAIAAYGAGSGGTSLGSIARAEADIARVKRRTIELEEQARSARDGLAALAGGSVALPDEVPVLSEPPAELDLEAATAAALAARGDVAAARFRSAAASARAEGAKEVAETPRFEVGATYMQMPDARPGLGAMVSMTMPWIGGGLLDESDAAEEESAATRHQASAVERAARVEIQAQLSKLRAAKRTLAAIEESELPAAERAARAERAGLGAANFDLTAWLLASHGVLEARIEREVARGSVARAWLELQGSLGVLGTEKKR